MGSSLVSIRSKYFGRKSICTLTDRIVLRIMGINMVIKVYRFSYVGFCIVSLQPIINIVIFFITVILKRSLIEIILAFLMSRFIMP